MKLVGSSIALDIHTDPKYNTQILIQVLVEKLQTN